MEIEKVSGDYRPLILVAEDDDSNFKLIRLLSARNARYYGQRMVRIL